MTTDVTTLDGSRKHLSDEPLRTGVDSAFGRNLRRLGRIKAEYDPANLFQINNNVAPAP
jgi:hypothetical protein